MMRALFFRMMQMYKFSMIRECETTYSPRVLMTNNRDLLQKAVTGFNIGLASFHSHFSWFTEANNQQQTYETSLLAKKERVLLKALKNKFEQELDTLEKVQKCSFDILKTCTRDPKALKVQCPHFNKIEQIVFRIHQEQFARNQEAIDVKRLLIVQSENKDVSTLLNRFEQIRKLETKYQEGQIQTLRDGAVDLEEMLCSVEKAFGRDLKDKNHQLMKSFVREHQIQLEEQIVRHEDILQNYNKLLHMNVV